MFGGLSQKSQLKNLNMNSALNTELFGNTLFWIFVPVELWVVACVALTAENVMRKNNPQIPMLTISLIF
jgi:hypothetical protein